VRGIWQGRGLSEFVAVEEGVSVRFGMGVGVIVGYLLGRTMADGPLS